MQGKAKNTPPQAVQFILWSIGRIHKCFCDPLIFITIYFLPNLPIKHELMKMRDWNFSCLSADFICLSKAWLEVDCWFQNPCGSRHSNLRRWQNKNPCGVATCWERLYTTPPCAAEINTSKVSGLFTQSSVRKNTIILCFLHFCQSCASVYLVSEHFRSSSILSSLQRHGWARNI